MRLILASNNRRKLVELEALLAPTGVRLAPQPALAIAEAEEPHATFVENALAKARHAARLGGGAALADDSGLSVDALAGAPGVASAHYATEPVRLGDGDREARRHAQDAANNRLLLARLEGIADRRARFVCTLVALRDAADPEPLIATGRWEGDIVARPQGSGGFGYDPLVYIAAEGMTVAQLGAGRKNAISHRALAARRMVEAMREVWRLG